MTARGIYPALFYHLKYLTMTREQAIEHAHKFEQELEALRRKYGISAGVYIGFYDTSEKQNGYPVMVYGDNCADYNNERPAEICQMVLKGVSNFVQANTGRPMIHEHYEGFRKKKP